MKVLFASAEAALRGIAGYGLERLGHEVLTAGDGADALMHWLDGSTDIALLDGDLPTLSGFDVCRIIRLSSAVPVVLFIRPLDEQELIRGYESGADDCIVKPFGIRQLQVRIDAVLRRSHAVPQTFTLHDSIHAVYGDLVLNRARMSVHKNQESLTLTRTEFRILEYLIARAETIVPAEEIIRYATEDLTSRDRGSLKVHVSRLRHKLAKANGLTIEIRSYPRFGYSLTSRRLPGSISVDGSLAVGSQPSIGMPAGAGDSMAMVEPQAVGRVQQ